MYRKTIYRALCALGVASVLMVSCGSGGTLAASPSSSITASTTVSNFPAMANTNPPGANTATIAIAAQLKPGVNFGNMLDAPNEGDWGISVTDDFINKTAAVGFKTVRLPVRWSNHAAATAPYTIDPVFMARVKSVVDKLLAKGIVVIMDMHHYRQLDGDALDSREAAVDAAVVDVRFLALWQQIASEFKNHSTNLIFELYNEPHGRLNGEPWNVLAARAMGVVRQTNPARAVVIGPTHWNSASDLAQLKVPNDVNVIVTIHNYEPFKFTHQGAEWIKPPPPVGVTCCTTAQVAQMTSPLDTAQTWSNAKKYPIFLGEFGAYSKADTPSRVNFNNTMRQAAESRGMGWIYWEFAAGFGVYDPASKTFFADLTKSLLPSFVPLAP